MSLNRLPMLDAANPYTDELPSGNYEARSLSSNSSWMRGYRTSRVCRTTSRRRSRFLIRTKTRDQVVIRGYLLIGFAGGGAC